MASAHGQGQDPPLAALISAAFDATVRALHQRLPALGYPDLRPVHCTNVFRLIDADGTRLGVLAERAHVTPQAMGEFVSYLQARGYLERLPDPDDRRAKIITLTPKGQAASIAALGAFAEIEERWNTAIPPRDRAAVRHALREIASLETADESGA